MPRKGLLISVDPCNSARFDQAAQQQLAAYLEDDNVWGVALPALEAEGVSPDRQEAVFSALAQAAVKAQAAIVTVADAAVDRQLQLLKQAQVDFGRVVLVNGLLGPEQIQPWLDAGSYIAYDGHVTYRELPDVRAAAKATPLERILCASNEPSVAPAQIAQLPGGVEDVVWPAGELVELHEAFGREAFMAVYDALLENAQEVLGL